MGQLMMMKEENEISELKYFLNSWRNVFFVGKWGIGVVNRDILDEWEWLMRWDGMKNSKGWILKNVGGGVWTHALSE